MAKNRGGRRRDIRVHAFPAQTHDAAAFRRMIHIDSWHLMGPDIVLFGAKPGRRIGVEPSWHQGDSIIVQQRRDRLCCRGCGFHGEGIEIRCIDAVPM